MAEKEPPKSKPSPRKGRPQFPLRIRERDMRIGKDGDLLVVGRPAQVLRLLILSRPAFYAKVVAPYLQSREASFRPDELWFDPQGRIHLTNKRILARARHHLAKAGRSLRKAQ